MSLITHINKWELTDNDCAQYIRQIDDNNYEMIQTVWLDLTSMDRILGLPEYCITHNKICLTDYTEEQIEFHLSQYCYVRKDLEEKLGFNGAKDLIAECILEGEVLENDNIIFECNTLKDAYNFIEKYVKEH